MHLKLSRPRSWRYQLASVSHLATWAAVLGAISAFSLTNFAWADPQPVTIQGIPQQVIPQADEVGLGDFTLSTGTISIANGSGNGSASNSSSGRSSGSTSNDALNTMLQQSWGAAAEQAAQGTGVNPSALAATCVLESGCQNVNSSAGAQGAFQMFSAAYSDGLKTALAADPSLASQIVQGSAGMNDPYTESIAASGYLLQANQTLQNAGLTNPTVLDARSYYEFGPSAGPQIAQASDSDLMSNYISSTAMSNNAIPATETVGQWRSSVTSKIGNAAGQSITS